MSNATLVPRRTLPAGLIALTAALGMVLTTLTLVPAAAAEPRPVDVIADGAWSWYMDPRVITDESATYLGSVSSTGDIQVTRVSHVNAALTHTVLHRALDVDDHAAPSLVKTPDGRIAAFYSGHGTSPVYYRVGTKPGSISSFGAERRLTGSGLENAKATYTQILYLRGEARPYHLITRIYGTQTYHLTTSKDLVTWSAAVQIIGDPFASDRYNHPYAKFSTTGWRTIHFAVTEGHPSWTPGNSLYHFYLSAGVFGGRDGTAIRSLQEVARQRTPIMPAEGSRIYDGKGPGGKVRVYDLALTKDGTPTVAVNTAAPSNYAYHWIQRSGSGWTRSRMLQTRSYPSGITLDHADPSRVFLIADCTGQTEVEQWVTPDAGMTWASSPVTSGSTSRSGPRPPRTGCPLPAPRRCGCPAPTPASPATPRASRCSPTAEPPPPSPSPAATAGPPARRCGPPLRRGLGGVGAEGATVIAKVTLPGQSPREVARAVTDSRGKAPLRLAPLPSKAKVQVVVIAKDGWGYAATATTTVP